MAEAVGLSLAVLPLVISTTEHFSHARQVVSRCRKFSTEAKKLLSGLNLQRTIFRGELVLLLAPIAGRDVGRKMLDDLDHPNWTDSNFNDALNLRLGDAVHAIVDDVSLIAMKLAYLESEAEKYTEVVGDEHGASQNSNFGDKKWRKGIGRRIKLSFTAPEFMENQRLLRDYIMDFRTLRAQTEEIRSETISKPQTTWKTSNIEKFTIVQDTSRMLYEALCVACTKHTEHLTRFSLQPSFNSNTAQIRFNLALRQPLSTPVAIPDEMIWLTIESAFYRLRPSTEAPKNDAESALQLNRSLKRERGSSPMKNAHPSSKARGKAKKTVHFETQSQQCQSISSQLSPALPNICKHNNLCNHLRSSMNQTVSGHNCIGFLEHNSEAKHLLYIEHNTAMQVQSLTKTLVDFFSSSGGTVGPRSRFWEYERLHLASALATAVLQFHPTPWLPSSLNSSDIHFDFPHSSVTATKPLSPGTPFVDVPIKTPDGVSSRKSTYPSRHFAPNPLLFRLGVILLELAFETPLKSMQKPIDREGGLEDRHAEFFTAKRVSRAMSSTLGTRYATIVRKCLQCDFGRGDDLSEPALQEAFYREVVCELEQLEDGFRKLQIAT